MAEQEPGIADLPKEVRGDVDKLREQFEKSPEYRKFKKAETDLARKAAFGAFDVTVPNEGEVNYQQYLDARPAMPKEGLVRRTGGMIQDVVTGKPVSKEAYLAQQAKQVSHEDYYYEKQEEQVIKSQNLQGITAYAREASAARLAGDSVREKKLRELVEQRISETIAKDEEFTDVDREARHAEEIARYYQLVDTMPERLAEVERRRAERENKHASETHKKPRGEGQPSNRQAKVETSEPKGEVETFLGDERVEVKNSFTSPDGETVVEIIGADGKTSFVRKDELTEKEVEAPKASPEKEGKLILKDIVQASAVERLKEKLQGDEEAKPEEEPVKKEKKEKKVKDTTPEPTKDEPEEKPEQPKKFIPGNFHGDKRVSLTGWAQEGDGPEIVEVQDEEGNRYKISSSELTYRKTAPEEKVPGKELELYTGPSLAERIAKDGPIASNTESSEPKYPGQELLPYTGPTLAERIAKNGPDNAEFGILGPFVTNIEARERQESKVKAWWDKVGANVREKAGKAYWADRWANRRSKHLERDVDENAPVAEQQEKRERNRYGLLAAGLGVATIALLAGGGLALANRDAPEKVGTTSIDLGEHLDWTQENPGMGHPLPTETPTPTPTVENLPLTGIDGTGPQEITP